MNEKKYQNIIKLNSAERYDYLVRKVADFQSIFLIYEKFWQMSTSNIQGTECILVFPEKDFAQEHIKLKKSKSVCVKIWMISLAKKTFTQITV